jgi:protein-tyrosine phosphatase
MGGISRSVSIVIAYVMFKNKTGFFESFDYVKKIHPKAFPNTAF